MAVTTGERLAGQADEALAAVLRETLELLRAALAAVLDGDDEGEAYGLTGLREPQRRDPATDHGG